MVVFKADGKDTVKAVLVLSIAVLLLGVDLAGIFKVAEQGWY